MPWGLNYKSIKKELIKYHQRKFHKSIECNKALQCTRDNQVRILLLRYPHPMRKP
jgi:hypothetical protein